MKKPTEKIIGYCSHWDNEQHAWVTEIPVSYLESLGYYKEKPCERCQELVKAIDHYVEELENLQTEQARSNKYKG